MDRDSGIETGPVSLGEYCLKFSDVVNIVVFEVGVENVAGVGLSAARRADGGETVEREDMDVYHVKCIV